MKYGNQSIHFREIAFLSWFIFFCIIKKGFIKKQVMQEESLLSKIQFSKEALSVLNKPCNKFKPGVLKFCL